MISNILPSEATHSSLDLFKRQNLLSSFDSSFEQIIGPVLVLFIRQMGPLLSLKLLEIATILLTYRKYFLRSHVKLHKLTALHYEPMRQM